MNIEIVNKWLDEEYGVSYTRLEELHDFIIDKSMKEEDKLNKEIERLNKELAQEKKDFKEANDYCFELKDYKSRCEKATEKVNNISFQVSGLKNQPAVLYINLKDTPSGKDLLNILNGDDKSE